MGARVLTSTAIWTGTVKVVILEDCISSGKSTFIEYLQEHNTNSKTIFLPEPMHLFENWCGFKPLQS